MSCLADRAFHRRDPDRPDLDRGRPGRHAAPAAAGLCPAPLPAAQGDADARTGGPARHPDGRDLPRHPAVKLNRMEDYQTSRFQRIIRHHRPGRGEDRTWPGSDARAGRRDHRDRLLRRPDAGRGRGRQGERTTGEFMSFFTAMALTFQPIRRLSDLAGQWQVAEASLGADLHPVRHPAERDAPGAKPRPPRPARRRSGSRTSSSPIPTARC
jgi:hypothetical protein